MKCKDYLVFDPIAFVFGPFVVRWYALCFAAGLFVVYALVLFFVRRWKVVDDFFAENFLLVGMVGAVIGGRVGYALFYDLAFFWSHPLALIWPFSDDGTWSGIAGMSFHGGLIGSMVGVYLVFLWHRRHGVSLLQFFRFIDVVAVCVPWGLFFGRIGNFLNNELLGRVTDVPWSIVVDGVQRHPSQLYEALGEGVLLGIILFVIFRRQREDVVGMMVGVFLIGYGIIRFFLEFFRQPDAHVGFVFLSFTMGQLLCVGMIVLGIAYLIYMYSFNRGKKLCDI